MPKIKNKKFDRRDTFLNSIQWLRKQPLSYNAIRKVNRFCEKLDEGIARYNQDLKSILAKFGLDKPGGLDDEQNVSDANQELAMLAEEEYFYRFQKKPIKVDVKELKKITERAGGVFTLTVEIEKDLENLIQFFDNEDCDDLEDEPDPEDEEVKASDG